MFEGREAGEGHRGGERILVDVGAVANDQAACELREPVEAQRELALREWAARSWSGGWRNAGGVRQTSDELGCEACVGLDAGLAEFSTASLGEPAARAA
jgi:hypothetical protein